MMLEESCGAFAFDYKIFSSILLAANEKVGWSSS